jgi:hypothetical protein
VLQELISASRVFVTTPESATALLYGSIWDDDRPQLLNVAEGTMRGWLAERKRIGIDALREWEIGLETPYGPAGGTLHLHTATSVLIMDKSREVLWVSGNSSLAVAT